MTAKQKKLTILAASIASAAFTSWSIYDFAHLVQRRDTARIVSDISTVQKEIEQQPPGVERGEAFIRRLKAINTRHAPGEVKQMLKAYIEAMEQAVSAVKAQQDPLPFDRAIADRKNALIAAINKHK
jgi:hypothetical protein